MNNKLREKVAIVTGGGQGAGRGAAIVMAREGATIVLFGRTLAKLEAVAEEISSEGGRVHCIAGDVTRADDTRQLIKDTLSSFGGIDILVNAAQAPIMRQATLMDIDRQTMSELWESGPAATLELMKLVHPHMVQRGGGVILNFGSGAQWVPAKYGVYAGVKSAIQSISRAAAIEWGGDNIRVNVIVPMVHSPANDADPSDFAALESYIPLGRIGDPVKDIGPPIAFLASEEGAYFTGSTFMLDGGLTHLR